MLNRFKADAVSIGLSFLRAFVATMVLAQGANIKDLRGVAGFLLSAAIAGFAAALRTAQTVLARPVVVDEAVDEEV